MVPSQPNPIGSGFIPNTLLVNCKSLGTEESKISNGMKKLVLVADPLRSRINIEFEEIPRN